MNVENIFYYCDHYNMTSNVSVTSCDLQTSRLGLKPIPAWVGLNEMPIYIFIA